MDINKQTLFIAIGAFILGVIFCSSLIVVGVWSYRMGQADVNRDLVSDVNSGINTQVPSKPSPFVTSLPPETPVPTPAGSAIYTPVAQVFPTAFPTVNKDKNDVDPQVRQKIMDYMYSVNDILFSNKNWAEPNAFAQQILSSTMNGDTSGFDGLISSYENAKTQISAITPPAECRNYHKSCIALLDEGAGLLYDIKAAMAGQDINILLSMQAKATTLESTAREVDNMAKEIYEKYNIPEPSY